MTEDCLLPVTNVELRRYERDMPRSFYTLAGSMLAMELYETVWGGREIAWRVNDHEPEA